MSILLRIAHFFAHCAPVNTNTDTGYSRICAVVSVSFFAVIFANCAIRNFLRSVRISYLRTFDGKPDVSKLSGRYATAYQFRIASVRVVRMMNAHFCCVPVCVLRTIIRTEIFDVPEEHLAARPLIAGHAAKSGWLSVQDSQIFIAAFGTKITAQMYTIRIRSTLYRTAHDKAHVAGFLWSSTQARHCFPASPVGIACR